MDTIRPRITLPGYKKALQEYGSDPSRIVEELVANSYDADAKLVLVIHSDNEISVVDNGAGIADEQFRRLLDLGAGSKIDSHESEFKRSYLGSFGFGIKAMINISKTIWISTANKHNELSCEIDVAELELQGFRDDWPGFPVGTQNRRSGPTGTIIRLKLRSELTPDQLERIKTSLYNIPKAKDFGMYLVAGRKVGKHYLLPIRESLSSIAKDVRLLRKERITGTLDIGEPRKATCNLPGSGSMDITVWCSGLDANMKVASLGQFAGVYVKVDGRVLKRNFQGEKVLDGISKYPKFKHGMRIEVPIDWVKQQISLGRDGLQFSNESSKKKFENELKSAVAAAVKPFAKQLESKKAIKVIRETDLRIRKAKERIAKKRAIRQLAGGYAFVPTDDYEMALVMANPNVLKKLCQDWELMDFNGQLDFDCLVYNKKTTNFHKVELEPSLDRFLAQGVPGNTEYIVTWSRGDWKVGRGRKGKRGFYELVENLGEPGHYKLLIKASQRAREPKQTLAVFCIDHALGL